MSYYRNKIEHTGNSLLILIMMALILFTFALVIGTDFISTLKRAMFPSDTGSGSETGSGAEIVISKTLHAIDYDGNGTWDACTEK